MENGSKIIKQNPHPDFDKILNRGYEFEFEIEEDMSDEDLSKDLTVRVLHGDNIVGAATFADDRSSTHCQNVEVDPAYRRQRIATTMYVFAEKVLGKILCNFWNDHPAQTPEAKALWAQSNRPFGNPGKNRGG